jgi:hypothetical protein
LQVDVDAQMPPAEFTRLVLRHCHPDTRRLLVYGLLACIDVPCVSTCGYLVSAATPTAHHLRDGNVATAASVPLTTAPLAAALGLSVGDRDQTDTPRAHAWQQVASFEAFAPACGGTSVPWFARSPERHAFARTALLQMLAPGGSLAGDPGLVRALFHVEGTRVVHAVSTGTVEDATRGNVESWQLESAPVAAERARASAKRWLQEPMLARSLVAWSAFAALEERYGRHKQALKVTCSTYSCGFDFEHFVGCNRYRHATYGISSDL